MSFKPSFKANESFKVGDHVKFMCGGGREGVVVEVAPEYFIIGNDTDGKDPKRSENQWIFYKEKDWDNIKFLQVINNTV